MSGTHVIIGGGLAGGKAAEALRDKGHDGPIVLVAAEAHRPYERPPLSKGYLAGKDDVESVFVDEHAWYLENQVDLREHTRAVAIDRAAKTVELDDGDTVSYEKLLLATGSAPRPFPGDPDVLYLRTLDDSDALSEHLGDGKSLVIVGGGWIGLEVAATARERGTEVTVVDPLPLPLLKILGARMGEVIAGLHRKHGVDLRNGVGVTSIDGGAVTLDDGSTLTPDAILVGIGAVPQVDLAKAAGLDVDNGVLVDAGLRTSDPDVFAVGDIANEDHPTFGRLRVEHWANALNQPAVAAANMVGGDEVYDRVPYFFTDQYEFGMEYRGHASGDDEVVVRGDTEALEFLAFWLRDGVVKAGMNVNIWDQGDAIAELVASGRTVDTARLADPDVPLDQA